MVVFLFILAVIIVFAIVAGAASSMSNPMAQKKAVEFAPDTAPSPTQAQVPHTPSSSAPGPTGLPVLHRGKTTKTADEANNHYTVLGVARDATLEEVKKAYRKKAMELHPDLHPGVDRSHFQRLQVAYAVLSDPAQRHAYDRFLETGCDLRQLMDLIARERHEDAFCMAHDLLGEQNTPELLATLALLCFRTGRIHLGLDYLWRGVREHSQCHGLRAQCAGTYYEMGYFEAAIAILEEAHASWEEWPPFLELAASCYFTLKAHAKAQPLFARARALMGDLPWLVLPHGACAYFTKDLPTLASCARWAREHAPEFPREVQSQVLCLQIFTVQLYIAACHFDDALTWLDQARLVGLENEAWQCMHGEIEEMQRRHARGQFPPGWTPPVSFVGGVSDWWEQTNLASQLAGEVEKLETMCKELEEQVGKQACSAYHKGTLVHPLVAQSHAQVIEQLGRVESLQAELTRIDGRTRPSGFFEQLLDSGSAFIEKQGVESRIASTRREIQGIYQQLGGQLLMDASEKRWRQEALRHARLSFERRCLAQQKTRTCS